MRNLPRWVWLAALLVALGWHFSGPRAVHRDPGVLVADAPQQHGLDADPPRLPGRDGAAFKPLATFALSARVLGRADYRWDALAKLVPVDLALGWGRMSDSAVLQKVDISQSGRFYFWHVDAFPIPEGEIIDSSANMHLIAADRDVADAIARTRVGDVVDFDGYLVEIDWPDGRKAVSSLTRTDSGPGACEIVWVERFTIEPR